MVNFSMLKPVISSLFQGSNGTMSKQSLIQKAMQMGGSAQQILPFLRQVPEKNDYTPDSLTDQVQKAAQGQGAESGTIGKVKEKVGI